MTRSFLVLPILMVGISLTNVRADENPCGGSKTCTTIGPQCGSKDNCKEYYSCVKKGEMPKPYSCKTDEHFNPDTKRCVRGECKCPTNDTAYPVPNDCTAYEKCDAVNGKLILVYCKSDDTIKTVFDEIQRKCVPGDAADCKCKEQGIQDTELPVSNDNAGFYMCFEVGASQQPLQCGHPTRTYFDKNTKTCTVKPATTTTQKP